MKVLIRLVAAWTVLNGCVCFLLGASHVYQIASFSEGWMTGAMAIAGICVLGIALIALGFHLWNLRRWARFAAAVFYILFGLGMAVPMLGGNRGLLRPAVLQAVAVAVLLLPKAAKVCVR
jgi:hypothetical protein